jgi:hypothetical protein
MGKEIFDHYFSNQPRPKSKMLRKNDQTTFWGALFSKINFYKFVHQEETEKSLRAKELKKIYRFCKT